MKRANYLITTLLSLLLVAVATQSAEAQGPKKSKSSPVVTTQGRKVVAPPKTKSVAKLPAKHNTVKVGGVNFFVSNGKYYRQNGLSFSVVLPPIGLRVNTLPPSRKPVRFNNVVYYIDGGALYQEVSGGQYEVVKPVQGMVVPELPEVNVSQLSINGKIFYEYDDILYKPVVTTEGVQYEVVGNIE